MMKQPPETSEFDHHLNVRDERKQRRDRRNIEPSSLRITQAPLPLGVDVFREFHKNCTVIVVGDMLAYDLYCEFVAFNKGELLSELAKGEVMMDPQNVLRSDWPVWHKAVQHSCGGNSFYFVPDEYIDRMIAGGQLKQMAGKRARVLLIPSLTEILRAVRSGDTKCVAYINRLLKRTFRLTKLAEDAGEGVNLSVFWLLSPLVDDCDKGVRDRYSGLLNSENALRMANEAIEEVNQMIALATNQYDVPVLDLRLFMCTSFFAGFRQDGFRFRPHHLRFVTQLFLAHLLLLEGRHLPAFARLKERWNSWALATWKLEILEASQNVYGVGINTYTTQYSDFTALDFAVLGFHLIVPTKLHERMNTLLGAPMGRSVKIYDAECNTLLTQDDMKNAF